MTRIVIIGGGPAGYESALLARDLGQDVTVVETDAAGGACVLYDCVPSKTFIASSGAVTAVRDAASVGVHVDDPDDVHAEAPVLHDRVRSLARAQSADVAARLHSQGVTLLRGRGRLVPGGGSVHAVEVTAGDGSVQTLDADTVLIATGATPRIVPGAQPDGERILTWRQVYDLPALPEHLVVIGSGVTGAEFASAYNELGVDVTLVSSRDRVLPHEDSDAAELLEAVFERRGMTIVRHGRAAAVTRSDDGVVVELEDGRTVTGSHCLMTVGSVPNTKDLGLEEAGIATDRGGFVVVDRVSRTTVPGVYAAGDCTGLLMLASVAAMQGRIAMWHALGEAVSPLKLRTVSSNIFTHPEIATVGIGQKTLRETGMDAREVVLPLATNARAKMAGLEDGFVKLYTRHPTGTVIGGVVVAPYASELILPITMAVQNHLTAEQVAHSFAVYPSLTGSITEAARRLIAHDDLD